MLFEKTNECPIMVATASPALTQATTHNILVLNENILEDESKNKNSKDELISLREEMKKRRKVNNHLVPLKERIMEQQEQLHEVKVKCFIEIESW